MKVEENFFRNYVFVVFANKVGRLENEDWLQCRQEIILDKNFHL